MTIYTYVDELKELLDYVRPKHSFNCYYENDGDLEIEFEDEDGERAQEWLYKTHPANIFINGVCIYSITFDEKTNSYAWVSDEIHTGYKTSVDAEDAAEDYFDNNN